MINTALLGRFRIGEFIQFINNTLIIVKRHDPEKLRIKALYLALLRQYEALSAAYKQDNNSQITPLLAALDARRDQAIICLRQLCDGFTHHFDAKSAKPGKGLSIVLINMAANCTISTTALKLLP